ncbi:carbohydrate kinase family protein [Salinimicrobium marinum]|nr:carbohydrate kinase [Salinimicrobium marinum]
MADLKAVCFGEVLFDVFPDGERIGGATLNVASRLSSLGIKTEMISSVGEDSRGKEIISYLASSNVGTENVSENENFPTGVVNVTLSKNGSATYGIAHPAAWDKIKLNSNAEKAAATSDVFIFGSLACRDMVSRNTLFELLPKAKFRALDFNLRTPHYSREILLQLIEKADHIKFNDDELYEIASLMGSKANSLEQNLKFIIQNTSAQTICVTKGQHGAVLWHEDQLYYNSGYKVEVKDTVGAGDSFFATLIAGLLKKKQPRKVLDHACAVGALVAAREGANPELRAEMVKKFMYPDIKSITMDLHRNKPK